VYQVHAPALLRYLRRLTPTVDAAEDLTQETFARAMRSGRHPAQSDEVRPWLYRIATNLAIDRLRRAQRLRFVGFFGRESADEADADRSDLVRRALRAIPPDQATALVLRLHEGFTPPELARMLGVSEAGVKSRLYRGRRSFIAAYRRMGGPL
jgi:RNA polymerase sigma-70 factor (ECF subfamily)